MKSIRKSKMKTDSTEMQVLMKMIHKNIIKLHEIIDDPVSDDIFLVMDYLQGGTIQEKLNATENGLPESSVREHFRQLISAVHYCHEVTNIAHRDIKPENMMLSAND